ncbi:hypothetical protein [Yersinia kristensenii]|uniref:hypothetical protein n=1 Tax=Yersinia kristensenii TaxID=28152 RepID=UPI0011A34C1C|nr:hypothetical protein [Yersinia kristensenii]
MRIKIAIFISILLISPFAFTAFNEKENVQLNDINVASESNLKSTSDKLKTIIDNVVLDNPEKKIIILQLDSDWRKLTDSKCRFEIFESKGTDAEISMKNQCMIKGYAEEIDYFSNLLP